MTAAVRARRLVRLVRLVRFARLVRLSVSLLSLALAASRVAGRDAAAHAALPDPVDAAAGGAAAREAVRAPPEDGARPRVILVSIDGLRSDAVTARTMPQLDGLARSGAAASAARCVDPAFTIPNHVSLLTGKTPATHGIVDPNSAGGRDPGPTIFEMARAAGLEVGAYLTKEKLGFLAREEACSRRLVVDSDVSAEVVAALASDIEARGRGWDLTFLHIADPDAAGHRHGWMSESYLEAVARSDAYLRDINAAIGRLGELDRTVWIVTADHGGSGFRHFGDSPEIVTVPWVAAGAGIARGTVLLGVDDRAVSVHDTAPTALALLGIAGAAGMEGSVPEAISGDEGRGLLEGDADGDADFDMLDVLALLSYLFERGSIGCREVSDLDRSGTIGVTDAVRGLRALFEAGGEPPACRRASPGTELECRSTCPE